MDHILFLYSNIGYGSKSKPYKSSMHSKISQSRNTDSTSISGIRQKQTKSAFLTK